MANTTEHHNKTGISSIPEMEEWDDVDMELNVMRGINAYGSGHAAKHSPHPLQVSRSITTGVNPVAGSITVPSSMQFLGQQSMQREHALQYCPYN